MEWRRRKKIGHLIEIKAGKFRNGDPKNKRYSGREMTVLGFYLLANRREKIKLHIWLG